MWAIAWGPRAGSILWAMMCCLIAARGDGDRAGRHGNRCGEAERPDTRTCNVRTDGSVDTVVQMGAPQDTEPRLCRKCMI